MSISTKPDILFQIPSSGRPLSVTGSGKRWKRKIIRAGSIIILKCYPVRADYSQPRHHRGSSRDSQKSLNLRNCKEKFRLLCLNNFSDSDSFVTLTYTEEPENKTVLHEQIKYFFKKLRKKSDSDIKYIGCVENITEDNEPVRIHIHLLISGASKAAIEEAWIYGDVTTVRKLNVDMEGAIKYCSKTFKYKNDNEQCYIRSRNLIPPDESDTKTLDIRNWDDWDELDAILNSTKEYCEEIYPEYLLSEDPAIWESEFMSGYYLYAELTNRYSLNWHLKAKEKRIMGDFDSP